MRLLGRGIRKVPKTIAPPIMKRKIRIPRSTLTIQPPIVVRELIEQIAKDHNESYSWVVEKMLVDYLDLSINYRVKQ